MIALALPCDGMDSSRRWFIADDLISQLQIQENNYQAQKKY
jgi:hypothetical protein